MSSPGERPENWWIGATAKCGECHDEFLVEPTDAVHHINADGEVYAATVECRECRGTAIITAVPKQQ